MPDARNLGNGSATGASPETFPGAKDLRRAEASIVTSQNSPGVYSHDI
jgi:hypothetical protein